MTAQGMSGYDLLRKTRLSQFSLTKILTHPTWAAHWKTVLALANALNSKAEEICSPVPFHSKTNARNKQRFPAPSFSKKHSKLFFKRSATTIPHNTNSPTLLIQGDSIKRFDCSEFEETPSYIILRKNSNTCAT